MHGPNLALARLIVVRHATLSRINTWMDVAVSIVLPSFDVYQVGHDTSLPFYLIFGIVAGPMSVD